MTISDLLEHRIIVCCGSGGVGKTSVSAALALRAADRSKKAVVATIDPARRLATAMGIETLRNEPRRVKVEGANLWAMMLDSKSTFDALISRYATPETRDQILANRFYQAISSRIAGTENYMAMEKLYELDGRNEFDRIVLDTPPTRYALDFLDSPARMQNMLQGNILKWLVKPYFEAGRISLGFLRRGTDRLVSFLDHVFGLQFLHDLSDFFRAFNSMYDGFRERSGKVQQLLLSRDVAFVAVAAPTEISLAEAAAFQRTLEGRGMNFAGFILNRVHVLEAFTRPERLRLEDWRRDHADHPAAGVLSNYADYQDLADAEGRQIDRWIDRGRILTVLPVLEEDIHDMHGLRRLAECMDAAGGGRKRRRRGGTERKKEYS